MSEIRKDQIINIENLVDYVSRLFEDSVCDGFDGNSDLLETTIYKRWSIIGKDIRVTIYMEYSSAYSFIYLCVSIENFIFYFPESSTKFCLAGEDNLYYKNFYLDIIIKTMIFLEHYDDIELLFEKLQLSYHEKLESLVRNNLEIKKKLLEGHKICLE